MGSRDGINTPLVAVVGFLGSVIVFGIIVLLIVVYYNSEEGERARKGYNVPPSEYRKLVSDQDGQLADYRLLDPEKKIVAIPIKRAMEQVVERLERAPDKSPVEWLPAEGSEVPKAEEK